MQGGVHRYTNRLTDFYIECQRLAGPKLPLHCIPVWQSESKENYTKVRGIVFAVCTRTDALLVVKDSARNQANHVENITIHFKFFNKKTLLLSKVRGRKKKSNHQQKLESDNPYSSTHRNLQQQKHTDCYNYTHIRMGKIHNTTKAESWQNVEKSEH